MTDTFTPATFGKLDLSSELAPEIGGYLTNGFIIRRSVIYGSVALLPRGFFNWKVSFESIVNTYSSYTSIFTTG